MKLYIAEKPSLGRALAEVFPRPHTKAEGYIQLANGDKITWCIGHLLSLAEPEHYDPAYKKWQLDHLPILPASWKLIEKPETRKQLTIVKKLIHKAEQLVHVGDPDREGQLLVDEVINVAGVNHAKRDSIARCLISDLNPAAIRKSLSQLQLNRDFIPLSTSALARSRADWLYGINLTRLCTVLGQKHGFKGVLSIGRVQTPLLGLVVRREREIEQFESKPFYELEVELHSGDILYQAKWQPSEACQNYMDEQGRVLSRALVENVAGRVLHQQGEIRKVSLNNKKQPPPLPFSLSALQIEAARYYSMSAKQVLDTCQQLYERHKLITYPRSDCRYLPETHFHEAKGVLDAIAHLDNSLSSLIPALDLNIKSNAWNDKKISAHHAIIPTHKKLSATQLSNEELKLYNLIARHYLMQFLGPFVYQELTVETIIQGGLFLSHYKEATDSGWKHAQLKHSSPSATSPIKQFPLGLKQGAQATCQATTIHDKQTTPPKAFTDATLLAAMTGIARFVSNPDIRKILKDTDGLGTEATRASIIELLFKRHFLIRKGKDIHATPLGRALISHLPEQLSLPDMTAQWEAQLNAISERTLNYASFMNPMQQHLTHIIKDVSTLDFSNMATLGTAPTTRARLTKKRRPKRAKAKVG